MKKMDNLKGLLFPVMARGGNADFLRFLESHQTGHAERSFTDAAKEARFNIKSSRKENEEENINIEGQLCGPGIAD